MFGPGLGAEIDLDAWQLPDVFQWLAKTGGMDEQEMLKTFNAGIGMTAVVSADVVTDAKAILGDDTIEIGRVVEGQGVRYLGGLL